MTAVRRALFVAIVGPFLEGVGLVWGLIHLLAAHHGDSMTVRHLLLEPPALVLLVGFVVSLVTIPVAVELASATTEETAIPVFTPKQAEDTTHRRRPRRVWRMTD